MTGIILYTSNALSDLISVVPFNFILTGEELFC